MLGALAAAGFYKLIKHLGYEGANPGQDDDGLGALLAKHGLKKQSIPSPAGPATPPQGTVQEDRVDSRPYGKGPVLEAGRSE